MDIETKRKEVTALIENIKKHSDRLAESQSIPMLELSAMLSKMNRLKESTIILKYLVAKEQHHEDEEFGPNRLSIPEMSAFQKSYSQELDEEEVVEVDNISGPLEDGEEIMVEVEVDQVEDIILNEEENELSTNGDKIYETTEKTEESPLVTETEEEQGITEQEKENSTEQEKTEIIPITTQLEENDVELEELIEQLEEEELHQKPDLNEQYSEMEENSVSDQLQKQPIADLISSIGLNERYLYANELFEGEMEEFKFELEQLNQFDSLSEARNYFNSQLIEQRNWSADNELVKALGNLVERRYL